MRKHIMKSTVKEEWIYLDNYEIYRNYYITGQKFISLKISKKTLIKLARTIDIQYTKGVYTTHLFMQKNTSRDDKSKQFAKVLKENIEKIDSKFNKQDR